MVGCICTIIALATPRVLMFFVWLLTDWFGRAYEGILWPVLGFLFMPYTTLAYMAAMLNNNHAVTGWWIVLMVVAVLVDISHAGGSSRSARRCRRRRAL